jgi:hypothetical protein
MKVNKYNQLGLNFTQEIKNNIFKVHSDKYFIQHPDSFIKPYREQFQDILSDDRNKNLLFTKTSLEVADKIKIGKFKPSILKIKQEKKLTFLIDENHFYRVNLKQDEIMAILVKITKSENNLDYVSYDSFKIMPLTDTVIYPPNPTDYLNDKYFTEFLKLLIFTEYSELQEITMMPNQSFGTRKQGKYVNETDKKFIIVDSAWNKIIIRTDKFGVSGHLRLQPIKDGLKLIYIKEYFKNGYVRGAKRNQTDSNNQNN